MKKPKPVPADDPVPFAPLPQAPAYWPIRTDHPQRLEINYRAVDGGMVGGRPGRAFLAERTTRERSRHHVGIDLYAYEGDRVQACQDGAIVAFYPFYQTSSQEISYALLVDHEGVTINYGEVKANAQEKYRWRVGDAVTAGTLIAEVSSTKMLHFETYRPGAKSSMRWMVGEPRPPRLLNPTAFLLELARRSASPDKAPLRMASRHFASEGDAVEGTFDAGGVREVVFRTAPASSSTRDGRGRSSTSGLSGLQRESADVVVVQAEEKLEAMREGRPLGRRNARQSRETRDGVTNVRQEGYAWGQRVRPVLPDAVLMDDSEGFESRAATWKGEVSYFGKFDPEDEGTGSPVFGTVQTNSSLFGISLPKPVLLEFGLVVMEGRELRATPKGLSALIEVYVPSARRLVRLPLVDVGPAPRLRRPADLTVAAAAWLAEADESAARGYRLPNFKNALIRIG